jgi:hypothetical protein
MNHAELRAELRAVLKTRIEKTPTAGIFGQEALDLLAALDEGAAQVATLIEAATVLLGAWDRGWAITDDSGSFILSIQSIRDLLDADLSAAAAEHDARIRREAVEAERWPCSCRHKDDVHYEGCLDCELYEVAHGRFDRAPSEETTE